MLNSIEYPFYKGDVIHIDDKMSLKPISSAHAKQVFKAMKKQQDYLVAFDENIGDLQYPEFLIRHEKAEHEFSLGTGRAYYLFLEKKIIGFIQLANIIRSPKNYAVADLSYFLFKEYQGRGYMFNAIQALISLSYVHHNINRFQILNEVSNTKSNGIAIRLGAKCEGILRKYLGRDCYLFSYVLPDDFIEHNQSLDALLEPHMSKDDAQFPVVSLETISIEDLRAEYLAKRTQEREQQRQELLAEWEQEKAKIDAQLAQEQEEFQEKFSFQARAHKPENDKLENLQPENQNLENPQQENQKLNAENPAEQGQGEKDSDLGQQDSPPSDSSSVKSNSVEKAEKVEKEKLNQASKTNPETQKEAKKEAQQLDTSANNSTEAPTEAPIDTLAGILADISANSPVEAKDKAQAINSSKVKLTAELEDKLAEYSLGNEAKNLQESQSSENFPRSSLKANKSNVDMQSLFQDVSHADLLKQITGMNGETASSAGLTSASSSATAESRERRQGEAKSHPHGSAQNAELSSHTGNAQQNAPGRNSTSSSLSNQTRSESEDLSAEVQLGSKVIMIDILDPDFLPQDPRTSLDLSEEMIAELSLEDQPDQQAETPIKLIPTARPEIKDFNAESDFLISEPPKTKPRLMGKFVNQVDDVAEDSVPQPHLKVATTQLASHQDDANPDASPVRVIALEVPPQKSPAPKVSTTILQSKPERQQTGDTTTWLEPGSSFTEVEAKKNSETAKKADAGKKAEAENNPEAKANLEPREELATDKSVKAPNKNSHKGTGGDAGNDLGTDTHATDTGMGTSTDNGIDASRGNKSEEGNSLTSHNNPAANKDVASDVVSNVTSNAVKDTTSNSSSFIETWKSSQVAKDLVEDIISKQPHSKPHLEADVYPDSELDFDSGSSLTDDSKVEVNRLVSKTTLIQEQSANTIIHKQAELEMPTGLNQNLGKNRNKFSKDADNADSADNVDNVDVHNFGWSSDANQNFKSKPTTKASGTEATKQEAGLSSGSTISEANSATSATTPTSPISLTSNSSPTKPKTKHRNANVAIGTKTKLK